MLRNRRRTQGSATESECSAVFNFRSLHSAAVRNQPEPDQHAAPSQQRRALEDPQSLFSHDAMFSTPITRAVSITGVTAAMGFTHVGSIPITRSNFYLTHSLPLRDGKRLFRSKKPGLGPVIRAAEGPSRRQRLAMVQRPRLILLRAIANN
jgi:hypothetical protein